MASEASKGSESHLTSKQQKGIGRITHELFILEKKGIIKWADNGFTYDPKYEGNVQLAIAGYLDVDSVIRRIAALDKEKAKLTGLLGLDIKPISRRV